MAKTYGNLWPRLASGENLLAAYSKCCRGQGTHRVLARAERFLRHDYYLKTDIVRFFPNVDHAVLLDLLRQKIRDRRLLPNPPITSEGSRARHRAAVFPIVDKHSISKSEKVGPVLSPRLASHRTPAQDRGVRCESGRNDGKHHPDVRTRARINCLEDHYYNSIQTTGNRSHSGLRMIH
jgi:retron-type reverse transcriptase